MFTKCRQIAVEAHSAWASWAGAALGSDLHQALHGDAALVSQQSLRAWEETVVSQVLSPHSTLPTATLKHKWLMSDTHSHQHCMCSVSSVNFRGWAAREIEVVDLGRREKGQRLARRRGSSCRPCRLQLS